MNESQHILRRRCMTIQEIKNFNFSVNEYSVATKSKMTISGLIFLFFVLGSYVFIRFEENMVVNIQDKIIADMNQSLYVKEQTELNNLTQRMQFNGKLLRDLVAEPLFKLHDIDAALVSFMDIPEVAAIRVVDDYVNTNVPYATVWRYPSLGTGVNFPFDLDLTQYERFETIAFYEGKKVGKIEIYYSSETVRSEIQEIREHTLLKAEEDKLGINQHLREVIVYQGLAVGGLFLAFVFFMGFEGYYRSRRNAQAESLYYFCIDLVRVIGFFIVPAIGLVGLLFRDYLWSSTADIGGVCLLVPLIFTLANRFSILLNDKKSLNLRLKDMSVEVKQLMRFRSEFEQTLIEKEELEQDTAIARALLDQEVDPAIAIDANQEVVFANSQATECFATIKGQLIPAQLQSHLQDMKLLPSSGEGIPEDQNWVTTTLKGQEFLFKVQSIPCHLPSVRLFRLRMVSRSQEDSNIATSYMVRQISKDLNTGVGKVRQIENFFQDAIQSFSFHGNKLLKELQETGDTLENADNNFKREGADIDDRTLIVNLMSSSLEVWEEQSGKGKLELAEESEIWRVNLDQGSYKTRTLDKYLQIRSLPKKPRVKDVIDTVSFVLKNCSPEPEKRCKMQEGLAQLKISHQIG